jgi:hypothetical protein
MKTLICSLTGLAALLLISSMGLAQQNAPGPAAGAPPPVVNNAAGLARAQAIGSTAVQAARAGQTFQGNPRFDRAVLGRDNVNPPAFGQQGGRINGDGGPIVGNGQVVGPDNGSAGFVSGGSYVDGYGNPTTVYGANVSAEADLIRSQGEFNRNTAQAEVHHEQARELNIDNRYRAVTTYFDVREKNREMRNRERGLPPTEEDLIRYNQSRIPARLSAAELDRQIGEIHWPALLMRPEFNEHRARLAELFYNRGYYNSGLASENYVNVKAEADRMLGTLQTLVYDVDPQAYLHAKKFIVGLSYEARFVATAG